MDNTFLTLGAFLIGIGFLLLVADVFLSSGVLLLLGVGCMLVGLAFLFRHDYEYRTSYGPWALAGVVIAVPLTAWALLRLGPLGRMARALPPAEDTVASTPVNKELEQLRGRFGKTLS